MSSTVQTLPSRPRLAFVDAARSLAMLLMVQAHVVDNLLVEAAKHTGFFQRYWLLRGLTAPLFFMLSGFAVMVASDSRWEDYGRPSKLLLKRLRRVGSLLLIGTFIQMPRWSRRTGVFPFDFTTEEWRYVLRAGVLQCVAVSLLVAYLLIALTRTRRRFTLAAAAVALGTVLLTPAVAASTAALPLPLEMLVRTRYGSLFPIFPYLAHFFIGATLGRLWLDTAFFSRSARRLGLVLGGGGLAMLGASALMRLLDPARLQSSTYWVADPALFMSRAGSAWLIFAAMALLLGAARSPAWLKSVSSNALSVYVAHLVFLYGAPGIPGLVHKLSKSLSLADTFTLGPLLLAGCAVIMAAWDRAWDAAKVGLSRLKQTWARLRWGARGA
ncbi:MAG: heparan-alpha-glucosaminide N-acetyltransferase domain-containing protein [Myxococcales bacterium]